MEKSLSQPRMSQVVNWYRVTSDKAWYVFGESNLSHEPKA